MNNDDDGILSLMSLMSDDCQLLSVCQFVTLSAVIIYNMSDCLLSTVRQLLHFYSMQPASQPDRLLHATCYMQYLLLALFSTSDLW